ncbi:aldose epimerase family protein [Maribacter algicola]|uniref:Aldose epimerase family protein n=1 Tax=Meishania litoralis TaxID=3434685 RepID=A0ACC7LLE4_9FLAO
MKIIRNHVPLLLFSVLIFGSCKQTPKNNEAPEIVDKIEPKSYMSGIYAEDFKTSLDGKSVSLYLLKNKNGIEASLTNFGQHLVSLMVPDKNGNYVDIVLGFPTLEGYQKPSGKFYGSVIGRYGNRIAKGQFELDGETYSLARNNGENHLHGGDKGFDSVVWEVDSVAQNYIAFSRISPDMEEGYPGNLDVKVAYLLTDDDALKIDYFAATDKKTHVNLTNHSFFNLKGVGKGNVHGHILKVNADHINAVDEGLIPTGAPMAVENTPFDFRSPKPIGQDIDKDHPQLKIANGIDHNFILNETPKNEDGLIFAASVKEPESGRLMEVFTSEPGVQVYTSNFSDGTTIGKNNEPFIFRGALCLETQHFPDSPNQKEFPSTVLEPGQEYRSTTVYKFTIAE